MTSTVTLTSEQRVVAARIDALDLEPVVYKLMHPEPGETGWTLAEADRAVAGYRCFLKLCAWHPEDAIVPTREIDRVWHTHILDTAKYAADSQAVFGFFLHHFPYLGLRGEADVAAWQAAYSRTRELFRSRFGLDIPAGAASGECQSGGSACNPEKCSPCEGHRSTADLSFSRPRPDRTSLPESRPASVT